MEMLSLINIMKGFIKPICIVVKSVMVFRSYGLYVSI